MENAMWIRGFFVMWLILAQTVPAVAWSEGGHAIISLIAFDLLTPDEQRKLVAIMERHPRYAEDFTPPEKLPNDDEVLRWRIGRIGYWPDVARKQPAHNRSTWHYELGPSLMIGSVPATPERPGPPPEGAGLDLQEMYASQAVDVCRRIMADESARIEERAIAMCWVAHLVADIHQPCHAGSLYMEGVFEEVDGDRGANRIPTKQRQNMHALWDQLLGQDWTLNGTRKRVVELRSDAALVSLAEISSGIEGGLEPKTWLSESRQIAVTHVYRPEVLEPMFRVSAGLIDKPEVIDLSEEYLHEAGGMAQRRAIQAAYRLAAAWKVAIRTRSQSSGD
jgi:hypothetical protein